MAKEFREDFIGVLRLAVVALAIGLVKLGTPATAAVASHVAPALPDDLGAAGAHVYVCHAQAWTV